jgi:nanoRNase/pAp phosphatase (c-di-AMP/oligoRNAs hydrolase)
MYGGGGHAFASAFVISRERFNPCWYKKLLYKLAGTYYITIEKYNKFRTNIF